MKIHRLYFSVEQLAEHWRLSIDDVMQLGLTNQLRFVAQADWEFPDFEIIHRGEHTPIDFEELANIYYASEPFCEKGHCQTSQDDGLLGANVTITYYPGITRLIIDASEVERFERENTFKQDSLYHWVESDREKPPIIEGKDCSENVWGWDGHNILVVSYFIGDEGYYWANCYGDVFGDAEFDDDYEITHWMPINVPKPPEE